VDAAREPMDDRRAQLAGWFRTPLGAALLTGALAGGTHVLGGLLIYRAVFEAQVRGTSPNLMSFIYSVVYTQYFIGCIFYLSGPTLVLRKRRLLYYASLWSILLTGIITCYHWMPYVGLIFAPIFPKLTHFLPLLAHAAVGMLIGLLLAQFYGCRAQRRACMILGATAGIIGVASFWLLFLLPNSDLSAPSREYLASFVVANLLNGLLLTVLPTIPIERAYAARRAPEVAP